MVVGGREKVPPKSKIKGKSHHEGEGKGQTPNIEENVLSVCYLKSWVLIFGNFILISLDRKRDDVY